MSAVKLLIIGAGGRGNNFASYVEKNPESVKIVGVAEPRDFYREQMAKAHDIPAENVFTDWKQAVEPERFADAVLIATQDAMHTEPAIAFAAKGYHMLLEKPMAPNAAECRQIVAAAKKAGIIFAVCHVMRYTRYSRELKAMLDSGVIGDVISMQHIEPVGYWHQAHSYVRGNWRNEAESSSMLLAKSCHDLDWIRYMIGARCTKTSSFGSLSHFKEDKAPEGSADRCVNCNVEATCPYSALKIYLRRAEEGHFAWPVRVITTDLTVEGVAEALRTGPYGRCVYRCDNDVVDHQVVNMEFEGGQTASFTMTAFTECGPRRTTIFGTMGELYGRNGAIRIHDFKTDEWRELDTEAGDSTILGGHGGGDFGLMETFLEAVAANDQSKILSGPDETLESHLMVFAAEQARLNGTVEDVV